MKAKKSKKSRNRVYKPRISVESSNATKELVAERCDVLGINSENEYIHYCIDLEAGRTLRKRPAFLRQSDREQLQDLLREVVLELRMIVHRLGRISPALAGGASEVHALLAEVLQDARGAIGRLVRAP